jgi:hypothetical protein
MRINETRVLNFYDIDTPVGKSFVISSLPLARHDPVGHVTFAIDSSTDELQMHTRWTVGSLKDPERTRTPLRHRDYGIFDEEVDAVPKAKYILFNNKAFFLFPDLVEHQRVFALSGTEHSEVVAAGFVELSGFGIRCTGESWSMATGTNGPVRSRGPEDAAIMRERLGMGS